MDTKRTNLVTYRSAWRGLRRKVSMRVVETCGSLASIIDK
jgi:hypothetical protein